MLLKPYIEQANKYESASFMLIKANCLFAFPRSLGLDTNSIECSIE